MATCHGQAFLLAGLPLVILVLLMPDWPHSGGISTATGQDSTLQVALSVSEPSQGRPPFEGAGELQPLERVLTPSPQVTEQPLHGPQSLHPPSMAAGGGGVVVVVLVVVVLLDFVVVVVEVVVVGVVFVVVVVDSGLAPKVGIS